MSVGLGNVWRFPFTAYENGGGAFLIPYIIVLIVIGRPLYYLEMGIGQFANRSCIKIWNMAPALRGWGTVLKELPLDEGLGTVNWRLALCLLASWLLILGVVVRGVRSSGKAAYFLALFPYVVMLVLLVRGCTLPGADKGMLYFVKPKWGELLKPQVWHAAVTQAFFSLNVGFGSLINYASFNNFRHNIYRDAMIVTTMDTFTSLLAGCTIFAILGNLAHEMGVDEIDSVVKAAGLRLQSLPRAIRQLRRRPALRHSIVHVTPGLDNICNDLAFMLKRKAGSYWRITWGLVTPIFLIAVLIYAAVEDEPLEYGQETYPDHYYVVGWTMMALIVALVPIFICIEVGDRWLNKKMPFIKALRTAFQPNDEWGPSNTRVREQWRSFKNELAQQSRNEGCTRAVWRKLCGCGSLDIDFEKDDDKDVKAPNP
ncbi:Sodium-dependent dopamine transporter [Gryllus bimaculatus]|nr:Sodium-dependent dopamine transporter [Gryllus bimaculatus]